MKGCDVWPSAHLKHIYLLYLFSFIPPVSHTLLPGPSSSSSSSSSPLLLKLLHLLHFCLTWWRSRCSDSKEFLSTFKSKQHLIPDLAAQTNREPFRVKRLPNIPAHPRTPPTPLLSSSSLSSLSSLFLTSSILHCLLVGIVYGYWGYKSRVGVHTRLTYADVTWSNRLYFLS